MSSIPYIDTNVFLRYLFFDQVNPHLSKKAKRIVKQILDEKTKVQTHILVVSELVFVLEKSFKLKRLEVADKLTRLLNLEGVLISDKEVVLSALKIYGQENIDFEDAVIYLDMLSKNISQVYTFDKKHFKRLEGIEIL